MGFSCGLAGGDPETAAAAAQGGKVIHLPDEGLAQTAITMSKIGYKIQETRPQPVYSNTLKKLSERLPAKILSPDTQLVLCQKFNAADSQL